MGLIDAFNKLIKTKKYKKKISKYKTSVKNIKKGGLVNVLKPNVLNKKLNPNKISEQTPITKEEQTPITNPEPEQTPITNPEQEQTQITNPEPEQTPITNPEQEQTPITNPEQTLKQNQIPITKTEEIIPNPKTNNNLINGVNRLKKQKEMMENKKNISLFFNEFLKMFNNNGIFNKSNNNNNKDLIDFIKKNKQLFDNDSLKIIIFVNIDENNIIEIIYINKQSNKLIKKKILLSDFIPNDYSLSNLFYLLLLGNEYDLTSIVDLMKNVLSKPLQNNNQSKYNSIDLCNLLSCIDMFVKEESYVYNSQFSGILLSINMLCIKINLIRKILNNKPLISDININGTDISIKNDSSLNTIPLMYEISTNNIISNGVSNGVYKTLLNNLTEILKNDMLNIPTNNYDNIYEKILKQCVLIRLLIKINIMKIY